MTLDFKEATSPIQNTIDFNINTIDFNMRNNTIDFNMEENTIDFNMDYMKDMNIQHLLDINNRIIQTTLGQYGFGTLSMDIKYLYWTYNKIDILCSKQKYVTCDLMLIIQ